MDMDQQIMVTRMADISLIKDATNPILVYRAYPPSTSSMTQFKGPFILVEPIKSPYVCIDVEIF